MSELFYVTSVKFPKKVFDLCGYKVDNGTRVLFYDNNAGANQKFYYERGYILPYLDDSSCISVNPKNNELFLWEVEKNKEKYQRWIYKDKTFRNEYNGKYITVDKYGKSSKMTVENLNPEDTKTQQFNLIKTSAGFGNKLVGSLLGLKGSFYGKSGGGGLSVSVEEEKIEKFHPEEEEKKKEPEKKVYQYLTSTIEKKKKVLGSKDSGSIIDLPRIGMYSLFEDPGILNEQKWCLTSDSFLEYVGGGFIDFGDKNSLILNPQTPESSGRDGMWKMIRGRIINTLRNTAITFDNSGNVTLQETSEELTNFQKFEWISELKKQEVEEETENFESSYKVPTFGEDGEVRYNI